MTATGDANETRDPAGPWDLGVALGTLLPGVAASIAVVSGVAALLASAPVDSAEGFGAPFHRHAHGIALVLLLLQVVLEVRAVRRPGRWSAIHRTWNPSSALWVGGWLLPAAILSLAVELTTGSRTAGWAVVGLSLALFTHPVVVLRQTAVRVWRHPLGQGVLFTSAAAAGVATLQALAYRHEASPFGPRDAFVFASSWYLLVLVIALAYFLGTWQKIDPDGVAQSFATFRFTFVLLVAVPITLSFFPIYLPLESPLLDHPIWALANALSLGTGGFLFRKLLIVRRLPAAERR